MWLIEIIKQTGPRTDPRGTPTSDSFSLEYLLLNLVSLILFPEKL